MNERSDLLTLVNYLLILRKMRNDVINMSQAQDKEKIWVPDRNWTYDLQYTGRIILPLSYERQWWAAVHVSHVSCILPLSAMLKSSCVWQINNDGKFLSSMKKWEIMWSTCQPLLSRTLILFSKHLCGRLFSCKICSGLPSLWLVIFFMAYRNKMISNRAYM